VPGLHRDVRDSPAVIRYDDEPPESTAASAVLAGLVSASVHGRVVLVPGPAPASAASATSRTSGISPRGPRQAHLDGFDLHANVWVPTPIAPPRLVYQGPFGSRPRDRAGLGVMYRAFSQELQRSQRAQRAVGVGPGRRRYELALAC
jgi:hypothetical protein